MTEMTLSQSRSPARSSADVLAAARAVAGSVALIVDVDQALVVLGGDIGPALHQQVRALAREVEAGATAGLPIVVLASGVTSLDLHGVWLLLELRRAACPSRLRLDAPSNAVREALYIHGLTGLLDVG